MRSSGSLASILRMGFGIVVVVIVAIWTSGRFFGECSQHIIDYYVASVNKITAKSNNLIKGINDETVNQIIEDHAKLVDEIDRLETPACLEKTHDELVLYMNKEHDALEFAHDGEVDLMNRALAESKEHYDNATNAIPNR